MKNENESNLVRVEENVSQRVHSDVKVGDVNAHGLKKSEN